MIVKALLVLASATLVLSQRPFFAGSKPIGYPEIVPSTAAPGLDNKFGEGETSTTTQRLPLEALGDKNLVDRLSKLPVDKQPFWYINWQALEAHRKNPQNYPQRPSTFIVGTQAASNFNSANGNLNPVNGNVNPANGNLNPASNNGNEVIGNVDPINGNVNSTSANGNAASGNVNSAFGTVNSAFGTVNSAFGNLNSTARTDGSISNRNGADSDTNGLANNNTDPKKPSGSVASISPAVDRIGVQKKPLPKPITEKLPTYQNQGNQNKAQHQVHYYNGYGYY